MSPAGPDDVYVNYPDSRNEDGIVGPLPASDGQGQIPEAGFFTGPEIGDPLPGFVLRSSSGSRIDLHTDRARSKAAGVFFRSAVWAGRRDRGGASDVRNATDTKPS